MLATVSRRLRFLLPKRFRADAPVVPVVRLTGVIGAALPFRSGLSLASCSATLERAFGMKGIKAVAIAVNSPGGSAVQSHLIFRRIRALAEEKKLPVLVFAEDAAASGGYMIACAGDEIFADPSSLVGSIGVVSAGFGFEKLLDRLGVERRVHTAGRNKAMLDPFRPEDPEDVERLKEIQARVHEVFVGLVRDRRGERLRGEPERLFSGAGLGRGRRARARARRRHRRPPDRLARALRPQGAARHGGKRSLLPDRAVVQPAAGDRGRARGPRGRSRGGGGTGGVVAAWTLRIFPPNTSMSSS
jgi:signal peptide peptidase SppA